MTSSEFGQIQTAEVNGTSLAYREEGQGEPVVFVHGTASDLRIWQHQLPTVGERFRAIAYSRRYARPNTDIDRQTDDQMLPHVEDLALLLPQLGAAPAHLVGSSWGGFVSLLTAIRHPDLVRSLVLMEPPVVPLLVGSPPSLGALLKLLVTRPATALAFLQFGGGAQKAQKAFSAGEDEKAMEIFSEAVSGREASERMPQAMREMVRENLGAARAQLLGAGFPPLTEQDVRSVRTPTLLLTGEHSPAFLLRLSDRLEELLPNVERHTIAGVSHVMQVEDPVAVNQAVVEFVSRQTDA